MPITESNVYALWVAKQSAKGTAASTATKRLAQVSGDLNLKREDSMENYSDLDRYGLMTDFVNTVSGEGDPVVMAQPDSVAYLLWLFFGGESFTDATGSTPPKYVFTPQTTTGYWSTWWKRVGLSQTVRQKFADCKITSLTIEGSTANKVVHVTPSIISLDPAVAFTTDPSPSLSTQRPFIYTDAVGTATIDGVVLTGQTQFQITIDNNETPVQGDAVKFMDLVAGNATVSMAGPTLVLDANGLAQYNKIMYGSTSPAAGDKPVITAPAINGSYSIEFTRGSTTARESLKVEVPGVKWEPTATVPPNPDGGPVEITLAGQMRKVGTDRSTNPVVRVTVETGTTGDTAAHSA